MKTVILSILLLGLIGCSTYGIPTAMQAKDLNGMSQEALQAYNQMGNNLVLCGFGGGPPGAGQIIFMSVPKTATGTLSFDSGCHPQGTLTLTGIKDLPITPPVVKAVAAGSLSAP